MSSALTVVAAAAVERTPVVGAGFVDRLMRSSSILSFSFIQIQILFKLILNYCSDRKDINLASIFVVLFADNLKSDRDCVVLSAALRARRKIDKIVAVADLLGYFFDRHGRLKGFRPSASII